MTVYSHLAKNTDNEMLSLGSLSNLSNKVFFLYVLLTIQLSSYSPSFPFLPDKPPKDVTLPKGDTVSRETIHSLATLSKKYDREHYYISSPAIYNTKSK